MTSRSHEEQHTCLVQARCSLRDLVPQACVICFSFSICSLQQSLSLGQLLGLLLPPAGKSYLNYKVEHDRPWQAFGECQSGHVSQKAWAGFWEREGRAQKVCTAKVGVWPGSDTRWRTKAGEWSNEVNLLLMGTFSGGGACFC